MQDGETVVMSGFLQDRLKTTKPASGLAGFFGAQARETVKSELVILLTPTVVNRRRPASAIAQDHELRHGARG